MTSTISVLQATRIQCILWTQATALVPSEGTITWRKTSAELNWQAVQCSLNTHSKVHYAVCMASGLFKTNCHSLGVLPWKMWNHPILAHCTGSSFPGRILPICIIGWQFHNTALLLISIFENPFEIGTGKRLKAPPLRTLHVYKVNKGADVMKAVCADRAATALRGRGFWLRDG